MSLSNWQSTKLSSWYVFARCSNKNCRLRIRVYFKETKFHLTLQIWTNNFIAIMALRTKLLIRRRKTQI